MLLWILLEVAIGLFMWSNDNPREDPVIPSPLIGLESSTDADAHRA